MKTRTLLLLSVGVGLMILLAGGVLLLQLSNDSAAVEPAEVGDAVQVGDVDIVVLGAQDAGGIFSVDVELGGVDDDISSFSRPPARTVDRGRRRALRRNHRRCAALSGRLRRERNRRIESGTRRATRR